MLSHLMCFAVTDVRRRVGTFFFTSGTSDTYDRRILKHRSTCGISCQKDLRAGVFCTLRCLRSPFVSCVMVVVAQATHARFSKYMLTKVRSDGSHIINMLTIIAFCDDFGL